MRLKFERVNLALSKWYKRCA